ncbi:MAG: ABC transporter ATP-binding protein [Pseudoflavonifractor sp.]
MTNAVEVRSLKKNYGSFRLDDLSFTVPGGSIVGLIGENGAGKSTTIKCLLNLIRRDSGEIFLLGRDNLKAERAVKEDIGVVLDESGFHDSLSAAQVGKIMAKLYKSWDGALYGSYLKKFDLPEHQLLKAFSRGMKMKLNIAAALAHRPKLLILDEATGGLDPVVRDEILDEFLAFISDEDHSILISSHITGDLEKIADYVIYLHRGKIAVQGNKDDLLAGYGRLVCSKADLGGIEPGFLVGSRAGQFGCEALVKHKAEFRRKYPALTVDPVTLDDIMVFTVKGDRQA